MIEFHYVLDAIPQLVEGLLIAVIFTALALTLSIALAVALTIIRAANSRIVNLLIGAYVTYIRGTPLLVQLFIAYYLLPEIGFTFPAYIAGLAAFVLNSAAIMHEVLRASITMIPPGHFDAARTIGLSKLQTWRHITVPQALIRVIPQVINEFIILLKATPLLAFISVVETFRSAQLLYANNFRPVEVLIGAAIIFFVVNFSISRTGVFVERKLANRGLV